MTAWRTPLAAAAVKSLEEDGTNGQVIEHRAHAVWQLRVDVAKLSLRPSHMAVAERDKLHGFKVLVYCEESMTSAFVDNTLSSRTRFTSGSGSATQSESTISR
jgi:hypothetical protein